MKKLFLPLLAATALLALPAFTPATAPTPATGVGQDATETYPMHLQLSSLGWLSKKVGGEHWGAVPIKDGAVQVRGSQIVGGSFTFDVANLEVDEEDEPSPGLLAQLKGENFFATDKYPTGTFVITSVKPIKTDGRGCNAEVTGNLTLKGITKPITFPAKTGVKDGLASASGTTSIDRTQFGIKYRSKTLLETAADKIIDDSIIISFNINAKKAARS